MSVWFVIPSKRPLNEATACLEAWRKAGYKLAIAREHNDGMLNAEIVIPVHKYLGWPRSVNLLVAYVMAADRNAEWFVTGGDDYWPDPTKTAEEIAGECGEYFANLHGDNYGNDSFGVMQPTGDRWGERQCPNCRGHAFLDRDNTRPCTACVGGRQATIDRIAGSPWMGREFCRRMYHGGGPLYPGYHHNFADEELQNVAQKLGVFWQRADLVQEHRHWARPRGDWRDAPEWAIGINHPDKSDWHKSQALFNSRKAAGFPGSEPLEL